MFLRSKSAPSMVLDRGWKGEVEVPFKRPKTLSLIKRLDYVLSTVNFVLFFQWSKSSGKAINILPLMEEVGKCWATAEARKCNQKQMDTFKNQQLGAFGGVLCFLDLDFQLIYAVMTYRLHRHSYLCLDLKRKFTSFRGTGTGGRASEDTEGWCLLFAAAAPRLVPLPLEKCLWHATISVKLEK